VYIGGNKLSPNEWSRAEDAFLLESIAIHKESKLTFEKIARALNDAGQNGELFPFRTATAVMYRLHNLRKKASK
jgi:hypothetical protein